MLIHHPLAGVISMKRCSSRMRFALRRLHCMTLVRNDILVILLSILPRCSGDVTEPPLLLTKLCVSKILQRRLSRLDSAAVRLKATVLFSPQLDLLPLQCRVDGGVGI